MFYLFLVIGLMFLVIFFKEILKFSIIKILFGIILLIILIKYIQENSSQYKITKKSIGLSILVVLGALFINKILFVSLGTIIHIIIYLVSLIIIIKLQKNKNQEEIKFKSDEKLHKKLGDEKYEEWKETEAKLSERNKELQQEVNNFINSNDKDFKLNWVNNHLDDIRITRNDKGKILNIRDIDDEKLRLDIVEYTKDKMQVDKVNYGAIKNSHGNTNYIKIDLPIKIIEVYGEVSLKKFTHVTVKNTTNYKEVRNFKYVAIEESSSLFSTQINILCNEDKFLDKKTIIIKNGEIIKNLEKDEKRSYGSWEYKYDTLECFNKNTIINNDYR